MGAGDSMATRKDRRTFALALGVALALPLTASCSSEDPPPPSPPPPSVCPTSLQEAETALCSEPIRCIVTYRCGEFLPQSAHCACEDGRFACTDTRGQPFDFAAPACVPRGTGNDAACPADEAAATGASCAAPGLQCAYATPTVCAETGAPNVNVCQCVARQGTIPTSDAGADLFAYRCAPKPCSPVGDAGTGDGGGTPDGSTE